jgi:hypothetical protein
MITVVNKPPLVSLARNPGILELSTNITGFINPRLLVDVSFTDIANSGGSDILYPESTEVMSCDISEYLNSVFFAQESPSTLFTLPEYLQPWTEVVGLCKQYRIYIRERSDDGPNDVDLEIAERYVLPGFVPAWKAYAFYATATSFWNWINGLKPFLTFAPKIVPTTPAQIQKLYWLCHYVPASGHVPTLKIKLLFTDGTTGEWIKENFSGTLKRFSVYQFHTGYTALAIQNKVDTDFTGKVVAAYEVNVMDDVSVMSEVRTYVLNQYDYEAEHQLAFRNSLGTFDTIMLTGEASLEREHTPEIVRVLNPVKGLARRRTIKSDVVETVKASTGWLNNDRRLYLSELLTSREVYEIVGGKLLPVVISKQTMVAARDNEELQAVVIEYQRVGSYYVESGD